MPPPGAAGRAGPPTMSVTLKRTAGLERAATMLIGVSAGFGLLTIPAMRGARRDAQAYLDGELTDSQFIEETAPALLTTLVEGLAVLAAAIVVIVWMYRIAANHRALHRSTRWGPGWAIGGWVLPPLLFVIPTLMFAEMWKAADPDVPPGDETWTSGRISPLIPIWFVLYSLVEIVLLFAPGNASFVSFGGAEESLAEQITGSQTTVVISAIATVLSAIVFIVMARRLGTRHRLLTGEDRA